MVEIRDYSDHQFMPFASLFRKYFIEVEKREPLDDMTLTSDNGPIQTNELQTKLYSYLNEGAKIRLAYQDQMLIGFLIYHWIFDCVLIVRAIYLKPEYRNKTILRRLILSVGKVRRVISQTYKEKEPLDIRGEKKNRILIGTFEGMNVWENIVGDKNGRSTK